MLGRGLDSDRPIQESGQSRDAGFQNAASLKTYLHLVALDASGDKTAQRHKIVNIV